LLVINTPLEPPIIIVVYLKIKEKLSPKEGLEFEIRLTSGNDATKLDYKIIEMFFRKSPAPNQS